MGSPQWQSVYRVIRKCSWRYTEGRARILRISLACSFVVPSVLMATPTGMTTLRAGVWTMHRQSLGVGIDGHLHSSRMQARTHVATQVMVHCNPIALVCEL